MTLRITVCPRLNQAFDANKSSGASLWNNPVTRRSFLKRSGGATVAALIVCNIATYQAKATVTDDSSVSQGTKSNFKIKAALLNGTDISQGSEETWTRPNNQPSLKVRRGLRLTATSPETVFAESATAAISINVEEFAYVELNPSTSPGVFTEMTPAMFQQYRGGNKDTHSTSASITKTCDSATGAITETLTSDAYNETVSGINIDLSWVDDALTIKWKSVYIAEETKSVDVQFHIKAHTIVVE